MSQAPTSLAAPAAAFPGRPGAGGRGQLRAGGSASGHFGASHCALTLLAQVPVAVGQGPNSSPWPQSLLQPPPSPPLQPHPYNSLSGSSASTTPAYMPFSGLIRVFRALHLVPRYLPYHILRPVIRATGQRQGRRLQESPAPG